MIYDTLNKYLVQVTSRLVGPDSGGDSESSYEKDGGVDAVETVEVDEFWLDSMFRLSNCCCLSDLNV